MASSVSSERAFSQAGITISKRRNRLKGDIVEALQFLKCAIHHDLLFQTLPSSATELEATKLDIVHTDEGGHRGVDESSWDQLYSVDSESDCEEGSDIVIY